MKSQEMRNLVTETISRDTRNRQRKIACILTYFNKLSMVIGEEIKFPIEITDDMIKLDPEIKYIELEIMKEI